MGKKPERTGYDYIPAPGEPYYPQGRPEPAGEKVKVLKEDAVNALIQGEDGMQRIVKKSWLHR